MEQTCINRKKQSADFVCLCVQSDASMVLHENVLEPKGIWPVDNSRDNAFFLSAPLSEETPSASMERLSHLANVSGKEFVHGAASNPCLDEGEYFLFQHNLDQRRSGGEARRVLEQRSASAALMLNLS